LPPVPTRFATNRPGRSEYYPNAGNWFAFIDKQAGEGLIQTFSASAVPKLYSWNGSSGYNVELHFLPVRTVPKKYAEFSFATAPVAGINRIDGYSDRIAADFDTANLRTILLPLKKVDGNVKIELRQGDKKLAELAKENLHLSPDQPFSGQLQLPVLGEGDYEISAVLGNTRFSKAFRVKIESRDNSGTLQKLKKLQKRYETSPSSALRKEIFKLSAEIYRDRGRSHRLFPVRFIVKSGMVMNRSRIMSPVPD